MIRIKILDNANAQVTEGALKLKPCLSFRASFWRQGQYSKTEKEYDKCLIKKSGLIYTGWLRRIEDFCERQALGLKIEGELESIWPEAEASLPGIEFRPDQKEMIRAAVKAQRGTLVAPTGSGKTVVAAGIISAFPGRKVLYLCPRLSIMTQTATEFRRFFPDREICEIGGGQRAISGDIVVSTIQSYRTFDLIELADRFDIVMVDEVHLAMKSGGSCEKILSRTLAPVRIGLTATLPDQREKRLMIEGLLGPIIKEITQEEAREMKILAEPKLELIPVPVNREIKKLRSYKGIHKAGIVQNEQRNKLIAEKAGEMAEQGKSVIVFCVELEHLENLVSIIPQEYDECTCVVDGATSKEDRELIRQGVSRGEIKIVISSVVWREGIDIPSLGGVILSGGGKAELPVVQAVGRAFRRTEEKTEAVIVDFLDPYPYLAEHTIQRLGVYKDMGWI